MATPRAALRGTLLMLAPAVLGVGGLFVGALLLLAARTAGWGPGAGAAGAGLPALARVAAEPGIAASVALTLAVAVVATTLAAVLGTAVALLVDAVGRRTGRIAGLALALQANLTVPHVVAAVGVLLLAAPSGLAARLAFAAGLIEGPAGVPALTQDPAGIGILLAYLWKEVPFVGAVVLAELAVVGPGPAAVARSLGASPWQAFRHVTLPALAPGIGAAAALVFAFVIGANEVPAVLGASHPKLLPVLAYEMFTSNDLADRPAATALSLGIAATALLAILAAHRLLATGERRRPGRPAEDGR